MYSRRNTPLPPSAGTLLKRGKEEGGENVSLFPSPALFFSLMIDSVFKAGGGGQSEEKKRVEEEGEKEALGFSQFSPLSFPNALCDALRILCAE